MCGVWGVVGVVGVVSFTGVDVGWELGVSACDGGMSYFCSCSKYASAVGTDPQQTSRVLVLARTNCTRDGGGGFSVSRNHKSLKQTWRKINKS